MRKMDDFMPKIAEMVSADISSFGNNFGPKPAIIVIL